MKKISFIAIGLLLPFLASAATLSVSPSSQSVNVGDTFSVVVNLDTQGASIDGVDLRYLNYNPGLLQLQDANASVSGVQIAPGSLMSMTLANSVDTNFGRITFSQVTAGGNKYRGSGALVTLTFKALLAGTASIIFNHTAGATTDSNVAAGGADTLSAVVNGTYTINSPSSGGSGTGGSSSSGSSSGGGGGGGSSGGGGGGSTGGGGTACVPGAIISSLVRNLYRGLKGQDVTNLQNFLISKGHLDTGNNTGFFGPLTEAAVKKFQAAQGIVSSGTPLTTGYGSVGPKTRARINPLLSSASCLAPSTLSLQEQIKILQAQVNALLLKLQNSR